MLTDLHLQKYLQGLLSDKEDAEIEAMLEKNPELKARLEALENQSQVVGRHTWQRMHMDRKTRRGSRTRYTTLLPALLILMVVLMVAQHWFSRPGANSTFTLSGGNGSALELLYNAQSGWRYLDAGYKTTDSLTFSIRDERTYHVAVMAVYGRGPDAEVVPLVKDSPTVTYAKAANKPVFLATSENSATRAAAVPPSQIIVFYHDAPLPELPSSRVLDLLESQGNERGGLDFSYQVFSSGH